MSKLNKARLGRGLSSLISLSDDLADSANAEAALEHAPSALAPPSNPLTAPAGGAPPADAVLQLLLDQVRSNPHQPRKEFSETGLQELSASLKTNGVIQPIVVRRVGDQYELIAGERRLRAAKLAGLASIPAILKEVDGLTQAQMALVENIQREDLNPIDRAQSYRTLLEQLGLSHAELATRLGEDRSVITNHLRLLELSAGVRDFVRQGRLSLGHAKVIAGVADMLEQERLGKLAVEQGLSVRNLEKLVQAVPTPVKAKASTPSAHIKALEGSISRQLGMRVQVRSKQNGKGKLIVQYASLDQFDELMGRLGVHR